MKPRLTERLARLEEAAKLRVWSSDKFLALEHMIAELAPEEYATLPSDPAARTEACFRAFVHYLTGAYPPTGPDPIDQGSGE